MKLFAVFALAVVVVPVALAQRQKLVVNPDASEVKMTLKSTHEIVNGSFHVQSGSPAAARRAMAAATRR